MIVGKDGRQSSLEGSGMNDKQCGKSCCQCQQCIRILRFCNANVKCAHYRHHIFGGAGIVQERDEARFASARMTAS